MAVTILTEPNLDSSAFNPNWWVLNSANKTKDGFRYIVEVVNAKTGVTVKSERLTPRPSDNYGEVDLSKLIQSQLEMDINFNSLATSLYSSTSAFRFTYKLRLGEEYFDEWSFYDTAFVSGGATKAVGTLDHPYQVGDTLQVTPTDPSIFPQFSGVLNVIDVPTTKSLTFDVAFQSTPANAGKIRFADSRKVKVFNGSFTAEHRAYKTAIPFNLWTKTIFATTHVSLNDTRELLTNFKSGFKVTHFDNLFIPIVKDASITGNLVLKFLRSDGVTLSKTITYVVFDGYTNSYINATPKNPITGGSLFVDGVNYYDFWIEKADGTEICKTIRVNIDKKCAVNDTSLLFEDRKGALQSLAFKGFQQTNITVTKESYNKPLNLTNGAYSATYAKGTIINTVDFDKPMTLNGFSYSREQDYLFEQLLTSYNVWMLIDGSYYPCDVTTSAMDFKDIKQTGLRRRTVSVKLSNKDTING